MKELIINDGEGQVGMELRSGSTKCPFDRAALLLSWNDGIAATDIIDILEDVEDCMDKLGKEILQAVSVMGGLIATNNGIRTETLIFYKRYKKWIIANGKEVPKLLEEALDNNKGEVNNNV